jgi:Holliday junction resolvase
MSEEVKKEKPRYKGKIFEKRVADKLRQSGWLVERKPHLKFLASDFFNLFDLIAYHPQHKQLLFIQAKKNKSSFTSEVREKLKNFKVEKVGVWVSYEAEWKLKNEPRKVKQIVFGIINHQNIIEEFDYL